MIDFHCHLDLYDDPLAVASQAQRANVGVISVTTTPSAFVGTAALAEGNPAIRTALGLHPQLAAERASELKHFDSLLNQTRFVGEVGLDGSPAWANSWADQTKVFERILARCAESTGLILSIHSRRATTPVLDSLEARSNAGVPVLHWFSGTHRELLRATELGCWFSVGHQMLSGAKGRALVANMPRERVLIETDGPFVTLRGRPMAPWDLGLAVDSLSVLWRASVPDVERQLRTNAALLLTE